MLGAPPKIIARHLAHPRGLLGRFVAWLMNRHNARLNAFAVQQLALRPGDRVMDLGFGGGVTLPALLERAARVVGVDRSHAMVERATSMFAQAVAARRASFHVADVEALPFADAEFDKVCTVNTIYFWDSLERGFAEVLRVLAPGGSVVIGFLPKDRMDRMGFPTDIFTSRASEDVIGALETVGFRGARVERPDPSTPWNVVIATRPAAA